MAHGPSLRQVPKSAHLEFSTGRARGPNYRPILGVVFFSRERPLLLHRNPRKPYLIPHPSPSLPMASDPNSPDVSEPIPNPSPKEEERLASISLEEPEGNHVAVSRLLSNGSSLPADFHAEDEIEVVEEELLGEGSSSHGGGGWREISEQDGEAVPCSPSSSGYAGERGSSGPSSGIEEVDDGVTLQDDWVPRKRHDDEVCG